MAAAAKPTRTFLADKYFPVPLGVPYQESTGRHLPNMGAGGVNYGLRSTKGTSLEQSASFEISCVKIGSVVWSVGLLTKKIKGKVW
jgi:hypothetical protein